MEFPPRWRIAVLFALLAPSAGTCYSQTSLDESLRQMEARRREVDLEMQRARIQQLQFDADMARMRAETNRMQADTERMRAEREAQEAAARAQEAAARQEELVRAATKKNEEEVSDLRDEITRTDVRTKNSFYVVGLVAIFIGFGMFVVKIRRRGVPMKEYEKFGLAIVIVSFLLTLLSLVISENWAYKQDFLTNLMMTLKIQLFANVQLFSRYPPDEFLIDFPTKYMVLVCISFAAYGVTTYLGITPTPWKKPTEKQQESTDSHNP